MRSFRLRQLFDDDRHVGVGIDVGIPSRARAEQPQRTETLAERSFQQAAVFFQSALEIGVR